MHQRAARLDCHFFQQRAFMTTMTNSLNVFADDAIFSQGRVQFPHIVRNVCYHENQLIRNHLSRTWISCNVRKHVAFLVIIYVIRFADFVRGLLRV